MGLYILSTYSFNEELQVISVREPTCIMFVRNESKTAHMMLKVFATSAVMRFYFFKSVHG